MARKAAPKGTTSSSNPSSYDSTCTLDTIASVCGFSLDNEEATKIANISLIQAKEEAMAALLKTKQKIVSSSETIRDQTEDEGSDQMEDEGSFAQDPSALELAGDRADDSDNLLPVDQG